MAYKNNSYFLLSKKPILDSDIRFEISITIQRVSLIVEINSFNTNVLLIIRFSKRTFFIFLKDTII